MAKRPMFAMGLFAFVAVLVCAHLSLAAIAVLAAVSLVVLITMLVLCRFPVAKGAAFCAAGVLIASGLFFVKDCAVVYDQLAYAGNTVWLTMNVKEELPSGQGYIVTVADGDVEEGTRLCLRLYRKDITPAAGDRITATVTLSAMFENDTFEDANYAKASDVYLLATMASHTDIVWDTSVDTLTPVERTIATVREYIREALYGYLGFDNAALCEGVLLGCRENIDEMTQWEFRASGIYHLLAVSGQHLSMLVGVLFWVLDRTRVRRRRGALVGMLIAVLFTALCGFSASVTRACAMTLLMLTGYVFRRRPDGLNSLGFAALAMITVNPFVIYDIGFQLSVASTFGIVMLFPLWHRGTSRLLCKAPSLLRKPLSGVLSSVGLSLAATLFTQPLTALYFKELSLVFLPANVICVPLSSILLVLCLVFAMLHGWAPFFAGLCTAGMNVLCDGMTATASTLASLPFATVGANAVFVVLWTVLLAVLIPLGYVLFKRYGVLWVSLGMTAVLVVAIPFHSVLYRDVTTVIPVISSSPTAVIQTHSSCGLIFQGDSDAMMRTAAVLRAENIGRLDWVLWMNAPKTTVNTAALQVSVDQLVLLRDESDYAALPAASTVVQLKPNGTIAFDEDKCVIENGDFYRILIGDTSMLILTKDSKLHKLPISWYESDILLLDGEAPDGCEKLSAQHVLVYCPYRLMDTAELSVPRTFENVCVLGRDDTPVFLTRGDGDITLRSY